MAKKDNETEEKEPPDVAWRLECPASRCRGGLPAPRAGLVVLTASLLRLLAALIILR